MSAFAPIFLRQKSYNLKFKYKIASRETFGQKTAHNMLVPLTPDRFPSNYDTLYKFIWQLKCKAMENRAARSIRKKLIK